MKKDDYSQAAADVMAERVRQVDKEGFTAEHDDGHGDGELALAACCYAAPKFIFTREEYANETRFCDPWPWSEADDKRRYNGNVLLPPAHSSPKKRRRNLVKAAALLIAEIERLDRAARST